MSRLVDEDKPFEYAKAVTDAYREGWDRAFGEVDMPPHNDNTGAPCRNRGATPRSHLDHDSCYTCNEALER